MLDEAIVAAWREAASRLGVRVVAPHSLDLPDGTVLVVEVFLPDFGGPHGAIAVAFDDQERCGRATQSTCHVSQLAASYRRFNGELFRDTLDDWAMVRSGRRSSRLVLREAVDDVARHHVRTCWSADAQRVSPPAAKKAPRRSRQSGRTPGNFLPKHCDERPDEKFTWLRSWGRGLYRLNSTQRHLPVEDRKSLLPVVRLRETGVAILENYLIFEGAATIRTAANLGQRRSPRLDRGPRVFS